ALAGCAADTVPNSTHDTSQQAGQAQVYDNSDDEGNQDITQLVKPSLEQVLVSEEQLHYLLKNRFGYDTKKPTPESPDHFSEEYLTQLRQEAHFRGLEILAEFYDVLPEPKHTEDGYDQPSAKINLLHRLENEISDIYFEAISNLSDEQIDKLKRLFNYVKTAATDYDRIFHTLGSIAFGLQEPTLTVEEKQRKGFAWDSQLFKTHPEKFIDEKTGKAREPQLEDYRELAEHEVRDRKGRFERGQRNFEFFTSEKMFALYDRYQAFGLHIFDGLFTLDSNLSPGFATPQNPNADYDFFMERYGFQAATTDALKEKIDYCKEHFGKNIFYGKDIDALDVVSLDFLTFLKEDLHATSISGMVESPFGGKLENSLDLVLLAELEAQKSFLVYLDTAEFNLGGLSQLMERLYGPLEGVFGQESATYLLHLARQGGEEYVTLYQEHIAQREGMVLSELDLLSRLGAYDGRAFLEGLVANGNTDLSDVEIAHLLPIAADEKLRTFVMKDKRARYVVFEKDTLAWFVERGESIDTNLIKEIYEDHGKLSRYDMGLVAALQTDKTLLATYQNRGELEKAVQKIYDTAPVVRTDSNGTDEHQERPDLSLLSHFELLQIKLLYDALSIDKAKTFMGNLAWSDINEYKEGATGKHFPTELSFDVYYQDGKLVFVANKPNSIKEIPFNPGLNLIQQVTNDESARSDSQLQEGYFPLFRAHLHATAEDDRRYSAPSGISSMRFGRYGGDVGGAYFRFSNELVVTTLGTEGTDQMGVNIDLYRFTAKGKQRVLHVIDLGKQVIPYKK
ncbi:hypothetical protein J4410_03775, partial [Candidatus Woesearchaeota archaeon]|nr:hypothetical protein [Candidatus Woesearchaeota archaeon]